MLIKGIDRDFLPLVPLILNNNDIFFTVCNLINSSSGMLSKCNNGCCEGDLCNYTDNTDNAAVFISSGLVASFVAILLALFWNLFPRA